MNTNAILNRIHLVKQKIRSLRSILLSAPEGMLQIRNDRNKIARYYLKIPGHSNGKYLSLKTDLKTIKQLSNKLYASKAIIEAETELKLLSNLLNHELKNSLSGIYDNINPSIKPFINPVEISIKEKIRLFQQRIPNDQHIRTGQYVIKTSRGEYVKSMAEFIIAETLLKYKVPYLYEDRFPTKDNRTLKPDFTAINIKTGQIILWEQLS